MHKQTNELIVLHERGAAAARVYGVFRRTATPAPELKISRVKDGRMTESKNKARQPSVTSRLDSQAQKWALRPPHAPLT